MAKLYKPKPDTIFPGIKAALDEHGVKTGQIDFSASELMVHNYNNTGNSIIIDRAGRIVDKYKTPDVRDLLKKKTRRVFLFITEGK